MADQIERPHPSTAPSTSELNPEAASLARRGGGSRAYGPDSQIFVFGVHGTVNGPSNVAGLTNAVGNAYRQTGRYGEVLIDSSFSWEDNAQQLNGPSGHRKTAAGNMAGDLLSKLQEAYVYGAMDRTKPLVINVVGFSHGGNVAIQGADELAKGLVAMKERFGIPDIAIHLTTASTPAYNKPGNPENPDVAARLVKPTGIKFAHTAFSVRDDGVIDLAQGKPKFENKTTFNGSQLPSAYEGPTGTTTYAAKIANHGAPQDLPHYQQSIAGSMVQRFRDLAPPQQNRRAEMDDETPIGQRVRQVAEDNGGDRRLASAAVLALIDKPGFDPGTRVAIVEGTGGQKIATQGEGALSVNARIDMTMEESQLASILVEQMSRRNAGERLDAMSQAPEGVNPPVKNL